jgi:membrane-bound lytic murein transglycosylase D
LLPVVPDDGETEAVALTAVEGFDVDRVRRRYDIPVEMNPAVAEYIRFFQTVGRRHFVRWMGRLTRWAPMMRQALAEKGLPEDTVFLAMIESGFNPGATSWARAAGLWQFIDATGRRYGLRNDFWRDERRDPVKSTEAAARYLKELYAEFGDWRLAWAAYNAGENRVRWAVKSLGTSDFWQMATTRVFRRETRHYVPKLMAAALLAKHWKAFGFSESEWTAEPPFEFDEVEVPESTDLEVVARAAGTSVAVIKDLNPDLRRWCTPPSRSKDDASKVKVPKGAAAAFAEAFARVAPKDRLTYRVHRVSRGDTLSQIARAYGSAVEIIMRANGLTDSRRLRLGVELAVPVPRGGGTDKLAEQARRRGFTPAPPAEEIPAAPPPPRVAKGAAAGTVRLETENGKPKTLYTVAAGDSLWLIAQNFGVPLADLKEWNGFRGRRATLRVGQEIVLWGDHTFRGKRSAGGEGAPATTDAPKPKGQAREVLHTVAAGESLWGISRKYGVTVEDLKKWNDAGKVRALKPGSVLTVRIP